MRTASAETTVCFTSRSRKGRIRWVLTTLSRICVAWWPKLLAGPFLLKGDCQPNRASYLRLFQRKFFSILTAPGAVALFRLSSDSFFQVPFDIELYISGHDLLLWAARPYWVGLWRKIWLLGSPSNHSRFTWSDVAGRMRMNCRNIQLLLRAFWEYIIGRSARRYALSWWRSVWNFRWAIAPIQLTSNSILDTFFPWKIADALYIWYIAPCFVDSISAYSFLAVFGKFPRILDERYCRCRNGPMAGDDLLVFVFVSFQVKKHPERTAHKLCFCCETNLISAE